MDNFRNILLLLILLGLTYIIVMVILRKKAINVANKIGEEKILMIDASANFFGQESAGVQIRGNGTLVLTKEKLYFELLLPKRIIEIPLEKIESIEECRFHLGKSKGSKLLKVIYRNESNSMDSCAWLVRQRKEWINKIEQLVSGSSN